MTDRGNGPVPFQSDIQADDIADTGSRELGSVEGYTFSDVVDGGQSVIGCGPLVEMQPAVLPFGEDGPLFVEILLTAGGFAHGFTYAGNPLACVAGLAVIEEIETKGLLENAASMGELLKRRLYGLMERFPFIGDVRGKGLLLAFGLVSSRETMTPLQADLNVPEKLVNLAYERGLIIYSRRTRDGIEGDHILVCPPMIVTPVQIEEIIEKLVTSLDELASSLDLSGN